MATTLHSERTQVDEMISRVHGVLGRVAALRSQIREVDMELGEFESLADELIQRLAEAQRKFAELGGPAAGVSDPSPQERA